ncbi:hypothetical protein MLD38_017950 [Melastoma candidum]|uniref:Uncharacterized protein n=1 Tax=Melastoma candidum TaxID=119954 RepID=A0ACB9R0I9_9MYRT|nr:hypothetical protein MLD38_017950 [Melastoma candidum]
MATPTTATASDAAMGTDRRRSGRLKRKKHQARLARREAEAEAEAEAARSHVSWRSESRHKLYSAKLLEALTRLRLAGDGGGAEVRAVPTRGRTVRDAADRALAFAAKGRTRWSRAVLMTTANKVKLKFRRVGGGGGRWRGRKGKVSVGRLRGKGSAGVQRKVRELGSLVPGCRKEPMNVVLEEATDYIAALEMQVRTMTALAQLLSGGDAGAVAGPSSGSGHSSSS